jgi:MFS family permease
MFGISLLPHINGALLVATGIIGLHVFIRWELRVPAPVLDVRLFRGNRVFGFSNLAALLNYSATAATAFLLSLYLQYTKGLTPQQAGTVLIVQPVIQAFLSPLAGRLSDRIEPRRVASLGMAMTAAGLGSFAFLTAETSQPLIIIGLAFLGVGFALFSSPNTNAIMGSVEPRHYGIASSAVATMRLTGQMFSTGIVMLLFALFIGDRALTPEVFEPFMQSLQTGFGVFALLCLLGIGASLARGRHPS